MSSVKYDIIIYSQTLKEHIEHVRLVIARLIQYNLKVKLVKCKICQEKVEYLSHIISNGTIQPNPKKIEALYKYPSLKNAAQVASIHGLASYYRQYIKDFASIISPLLLAAQEK